MTHSNTSPLPAMRGRQHGVALIVAMILLVVVTLMGLAGMQNTALQERMSGNMYDRSVAMQSAEAAVRAAQAAISANPLGWIDCVVELCDAVPANTFTSDRTDWNVVAAPFLMNDALRAGATPEFHIQFIAQSDTEDPFGQASSANSAQYGSMTSTSLTNFYRITVRSDVPGANPTRARVTLQATAFRF